MGRGKYGLGHRFSGENVCTCCGSKLNPKTKVVLIKRISGPYVSEEDYNKGLVPPEDDQGGFDFGPGCAKTILRNGGDIPAKPGKKAS